MFYEKWFDPGDLILYSPPQNFLAYDDDFNPYELSDIPCDQVGIFLSYIEEDNYSLCKVFISCLGKSITVSQTRLRLLSKKR